MQNPATKLASVIPLSDVAFRLGKLLGLSDSPESQQCLKGTDVASEFMSPTLIATRVGDAGSKAVSVPFSHI